MRFPELPTKLRVDAIAPWWKFAIPILLAVGAIPGAANATLITRDVDVTLNAANIDSYDLDVDLNGTADFTFTAAFVEDPSFGIVGFDTVDVPFGSINGLVIDAATGSGFPTASLLGPGDTVSAANLFSFGSFDQSNLFFVTPFDPPSGNFEGKTGFIGFQFDRGGQTHFGFAEITVNALTSPTDPLGLHIGLIGYNDVAGEGTTVSQTPEPGTLGLAAMGLLTIVGRSWSKCRLKSSD